MRERWSCERLGVRRQLTSGRRLQDALAVKLNGVLDKLKIATPELHLAIR